MTSFAETGSPGQPVGQYGLGYHPGKVGGALKTSWTEGTADQPGFGSPRWENPTTAIIGTNSPYAVQNEYGISATGGPYTQRSTVGGRHSVAHTVAGFEKLVEAEVAKAR